MNSINCPLILAQLIELIGSIGLTGLINQSSID